MPSAARVGDATSHPGQIVGPGVESVLIGGLPPATVGDEHACGFPSSPPHPATAVAAGSTSVIIGGRRAARVGDSVGCGAIILHGYDAVEIGD